MVLIVWPWCCFNDIDDNFGPVKTLVCQRKPSSAAEHTRTQTSDFMNGSTHNEWWSPDRFSVASWFSSKDSASLKKFLECSSTKKFTASIYYFLSSWIEYHPRNQIVGFGDWKVSDNSLKVSSFQGLKGQGKSLNWVNSFYFYWSHCIQQPASGFLTLISYNIITYDMT